MSYDIALCAFNICLNNLLLLQRKNRERRQWRRAIFSKGISFSVNHLEKLKLQDGNGFRDFVRMRPTDFEDLLQLIGAKISKKSTVCRETIPPSIRLAVTLRFLANGESFTSLVNTFRISKQAISSIVPQVCEAIITSLKGSVKLPKANSEWAAVAEQFSAKWNLPHCLGSMNGIHIPIEAPTNGRQQYLNYKNEYSIVLLGVGDADYKFIYADVGCQGSVSDGSVFNETSLYEKMVTNELNIPPEKPLPNRSTPVPYVFIADDAFALDVHVMKPYPGESSLSSEKIFNRRLIRVQQIMENIFGILCSKFRVLLKPMGLHLDKVESVVLSCIYLHNFLLRNSESSSYYISPGSVDYEGIEGIWLEGQWRSEIENGLVYLEKTPLVALNSELEMRSVRTEFTDYFLSPTGAVPWQNQS